MHETDREAPCLLSLIKTINKAAAAATAKSEGRGIEKERVPETAESRRR